MSWEIDFLKYVISNFHSDTMTLIMKLITNLGNYGFIWILIDLLLLIRRKTRKTGIIMAVSLISVFVIVNVIIKPLIGRERPFEVSSEILNNILIALPADGSFPSGHTAAAFASAAAVFCCNRKYGGILLTAACIMGISRVYFAVHFPTDVIGGLCIGVIVGVLSYKFTSYKFLSKNIKNS
ncbi:MAG: phosphatase PAP2 family protein [Clostridia bacterium]|nr:phosphatase PAP2 family protein [Clostridia bacterium]